MKSFWFHCSINERPWDKRHSSHTTLPSPGRRSECQPSPCSWSPSQFPSSSELPPRSRCTGGWWPGASCHKTRGHPSENLDKDHEDDDLVSSDLGMIRGSRGGWYNNLGTGIWTPDGNKIWSVLRSRIFRLTSKIYYQFKGHFKMMTTLVIKSENNNESRWTNKHTNDIYLRVWNIVRVQFWDDATMGQLSTCCQDFPVQMAHLASFETHNINPWGVLGGQQ